jgi:regulatory protein
LQQDEGRQKVKSYLLKLLSMRSHARQELFTKAKRKDYSDEIINDILDEFESRGLIDDEVFACQFAHDKSYLNHWGPAKIEAHLLKKGIPKEISGQAISDVFEEIDLKSCFTQLIEKRRWKFMREENLLRRKKKIADYLRRKGYYASDIYKHLDFLAEMLEE